MADSRFNRELLARFPHCYVSPSGAEVWVRKEHALAAVDLAQGRGLPLLGMEGFVVGESGVYPAMSRIADFSYDSFAGDPYECARTLLNGEWSSPPEDVHPDAEGDYMIDIVVED
ncbi:MAG: hypothetical protein ABIM89_02740 [Mycobacteriales bacterium]